MSLSLGQEQVNGLVGDTSTFNMVHPVDLDALLYKQ